MTDRIAGYIVTLSDDIREDDAEAILNAIRMVKNVQSVDTIVSDIALHLAEQRLVTQIRNKLYTAIDEVLP